MKHETKYHKCFQFELETTETTAEEKRIRENPVYWCIKLLNSFKKEGGNS